MNVPSCPNKSPDIMESPFPVFGSTRSSCTRVVSKSPNIASDDEQTDDVSKASRSARSIIQSTRHWHLRVLAKTLLCSHFLRARFCLLACKYLIFEPCLPGLLKRALRHLLRCCAIRRLLRRLGLLSDDVVPWLLVCNLDRFSVHNDGCFMEMGSEVVLFVTRRALWYDQ